MLLHWLHRISVLFLLPFGSYLLLCLLGFVLYPSDMIGPVCVCVCICVDVFGYINSTPPIPHINMTLESFVINWSVEWWALLNLSPCNDATFRTVSALFEDAVSFPPDWLNNPRVLSRLQMSRTHCAPHRNFWHSPGLLGITIHRSDCLPHLDRFVCVYVSTFSL